MERTNGEGDTMATTRTGASRGAKGKGRARGSGSGGGAGGAGAAGTLQDLALDLQRTAGNAATTLAVQRLVEGGTGGTALQHPLLAGDPRIVEAANGNPLTIGMTNGSVKTTQTALDQVGFTPARSTKPDGSFDGAWGGGMTEAVRGFQQSNDVRPVGGHEAGPKTFRALDGALLSKGGGGGGGGGVDILPPGTEVVNTEVERLLDQIMLEYSRLLVTQSKAVTQVERDLRGGLEKASDSLLTQALVFGAEKVLDGLLGGAPSSLRAVVKAAIDLPDSVKDVGVDKPFDAAKSAATEAIKAELAAPTSTEPLSAFVDAQHSALAAATLEQQTAFVGVTKPGLRAFSDEDTLAFLADPTGPDPRIAKTQKLLASVKAGSAQAFEKQYHSTVNRWVLVNAQRTLGTSGPTAEDQHTFVFDLRKSTGTHSVPGILELDFAFDPDNPRSPATLRSAAISGLSPAVRAHLGDPAKSGDPTVGELGFPARAKGETGIVSAFDLGTNVRVARDEGRVDFQNINSDEDGNRYLVDKGDGDFRLGIERLFAELDRIRVSTIGGLKGP